MSTHAKSVIIISHDKPSVRTEANARAQLLEHLGFHSDAIARAAMEYSEDLSKGVESMSIQENSTAPMVRKTAIPGLIIKPCLN